MPEQAKAVRRSGFEIFVAGFLLLPSVMLVLLFRAAAIATNLILKEVNQVQQF